ncbi:MAG: TRAP transporter large permease, partial [Gemmatimonadota bacterium]|nr:TRAP transporter large permease [Gemmatimonadota bacterium]
MLTTVGVLAIILLLFLLLLGVPIAFAMGAAGLLGILVLEGPAAAMAQAALVPWAEARSFVLVTIPLF